MRSLTLRRVVAVSILSFFAIPNTQAKNALGVLPKFNRSAMLNYPPLPKELIDASKNSSNGARVADRMLGQDWALGHIGFFKIFTPLIQPAQASVASCSSDIVVAVVDTGIDYTHPELKNSLWRNWKETGPWTPANAAEVAAAAPGCRDKSCNGIDDDNNGFIDDVAGWDFVHDVPLPYDTHGHGTHIAGIISAASANNFGVTGVCPGASIMALKYYDNSGLGYNNLANTVKAIAYAVKMGAQIINYSGGGSDPSPAERAAIDEAQRHGILFVAAAGNEGHDNRVVPYYPASYNLENIVSVASISPENHLLPSSNYGTNVHIAAPGLSILSSLPEGKEGTMSGTSQATAFATGVAALLASQLKAAHTNFDYKKIKHWIVDGAKPMPLSKTRVVGGGLLNVPGSLALQRDEMKSQAPAVAVSPSGRTSVNR